MEMRFEYNSFGKRMRSMLKVDFRRMFTMRLFYIMTGICLVMPILILVMTTITDGSVTVNPQTGAETVIEGFDYTWQIIGSASGENTSAGMSMISMCNINLLYFFVAVLVCLFVSEDFKSGYAKNLFTVRSKKSDYVISKTLIGFVCGVFMLLAFFAGTILGGVVSGLPFDTGTAGAGGIAMCMLAKMFLIAVFVPIYIAVSTAAKQRAWLSIVGSLCVGMLLFMMIPMITPLDSSMLNVALCLAGGVLFSAGLGFVSNKILTKTSLV
ncbi:MAG: ABC transporter permease [Porcipelethomonas sp.]